MWYDKILTIFKSKDLRNRILFVLGMLAIFRFAASIPVPGIDKQQLVEFFNNNQFFGLINLFTGGAMQNLSIVMLGLGPYITAVIIMQLLTLIFPRLNEMYKEEGEAGKQKFNQYGRLLTIPLAAVQSFGMLQLLSRKGAIGSLGGPELLASIFMITAGSVFLMWLGELISEKGIGNGVSLLIFAGIIARTPVQIKNLILNYDPSQLPSYVMFALAAIAIIIGVVIVNEARRNIPISYAKRVKGRRMYGGVSTYLPMMVNPAGVIPLIFALAVMVLPQMIGNMLSGSSVEIVAAAATKIAEIFSNAWVYGGFYFALVILFTYFYTAVTFDPKNISENLQKMGGFIPGIRPGKKTSEFLSKILNRILLVGAMFLGFIAVMPSIIQGFTGISSFGFVVGGTSVLIIVAVVLETQKEVESQLEMREYE